MNTKGRITCAAILFDLDGVLVDSTPAVERHWLEWCLKHKLDYNHVISIAHGRKSIETMKVVAPHLNVIEEAIAYEKYECEDMVGVGPIAGAFELLSTLPKDKWGIVTSSGRNLAYAKLSHIGLPIPDLLISADDVQSGKPHPEGYLKGAQSLGIEPKTCLVIEDSPNGLKAALAANMICLGVATTHKEHELANATLVASSLRAVTLAGVENSYLNIDVS